MAINVVCIYRTKYIYILIYGIYQILQVLWSFESVDPLLNSFPVFEHKENITLSPKYHLGVAQYLKTGWSYL